MQKLKLVKGPSNGAIIHAYFDGRSKANFSNLKETTVLILLSIKNNEHCAGDYLGSIVNQALSAYKFSTFLVADEIYWHNLKGKDFNLQQEAELKKQALCLGDEFIDENLQYFLSPLHMNVDEFNKHYNYENIDGKIKKINDLAQQCGKHFEIVRWHDWVNSPKHSFQSQKINITAMYASVPALQNAIELTANSFTERHPHVKDRQLLLERSRGYLQEESPAIMWISAALGYNFIAYPGEILESFQATKDYFITKNNSPQQEQSVILQVAEPELLANWLKIRFKKTHAKQEQTASTVTSLSPLLNNFFQSANANENQQEQLQSKELQSLVMAATMGICSLDEVDMETKSELVAKVLQKLMLPQEQTSTYTNQNKI